MSQKIQTSLIGRTVKLGWSMDQVSDFRRKQISETGVKLSELPSLSVKTLPDKYAKHAQKIGKIVSVYLDKGSNGMEPYYTVEVGGDLLELSAKFNFEMYESEFQNAD